MRARTIMIALTTATLVALPSFAHALYAGEPEPDLYATEWIGLPTLFPNAPYGTFQTAVKAGDTFALSAHAHSVFGSPPEFSADLSALGGSLETATGTWGGYGDLFHYPVLEPPSPWRPCQATSPMASSGYRSQSPTKKATRPPRPPSSRLTTLRPPSRSTRSPSPPPRRAL